MQGGVRLTTTHVDSTLMATRSPPKRGVCGFESRLSTEQSLKTWGSNG